MVVQEALKNAVKQLEEKNIMTPLLDAEVLLCDVLKVDRLYLYIQRENELTHDQEAQFREMIQQRLKGKPVQYIINKQEFMGLDFYVEEGVLIPRPDTEILVEAVVGWIKEQGNQQVKIADLGTGSGAITVSLAAYIEKSHIYSVDISPIALRIGDKNARSHGVIHKIDFLHGDLLEPLIQKELEDSLDVLVSNPPYIPAKEIDGLQIEVAAYEPRLALDGGTDGLDFYRRIVRDAHIFLKNGGLLALEVGHDQAEDIKKMMEAQSKYTNIKKIKDLAGIERVVMAEVVK